MSYIVTRSVSEGRRAGIVSTAAIATGTFVHVAAATAGLSALLASSATAFSIVRYLGAGYLIYLGIRALRSKDATGHTHSAVARPLRTVFRDGVVVAALNPKTALFFIAFLPQFVDPGRGPVPVQLAVLGLVLVLVPRSAMPFTPSSPGPPAGGCETGTVCTSTPRWLTGSAYITLGVTAAVTGERPRAG